MKLKYKVEKVLQENAEARNSDITLMVEIWRRFHEVGDIISVKDLYELPREDNIKRIRAKFNAEGKYLPTDLAIAKRRGIKEEDWRTALGYPATEETKNPSREVSYTKRPPVSYWERGIVKQPQSQPSRLFDIPKKPEIRL